jgi:glycerol-3-phosphate cytidylyltransferase
MSVVYTGGTFDLLHAGHIDLLEACREISGRQGQVVVSLNTDEFVQQYKGAPPVIPFAERVRMLEAVRYVDAVTTNTGGEDSRPAIERVAPDFIVVGSDWASRDYLGQLGVTQEWLNERRIFVLYVPRFRPVASSLIRNRMEADAKPSLVTMVADGEEIQYPVREFSPHRRMLEGIPVGEDCGKDFCGDVVDDRGTDPYDEVAVDDRQTRDE